MKAKHKRLIIGVASIATLDLVGLITMISNPVLTERIIPALGAVQIFGFVAIAAIVVTSRREYTSETEADKEHGSTGKQWVPWLFGFLALLSFLRAGLALLYIAGEEGHSHSWFSPISGMAMGCFFLWLAVSAVRSASRRESKGKIGGTNPGQ
jgi:hypothetical protein